MPLETKRVKDDGNDETDSKVLERSRCKVHNENGASKHRITINDYVSCSGTNGGLISHEKTSQDRVDSDSQPSNVCNDSNPENMAEDSCISTAKTVLVPVRDPVTNKIKNTLVPVEVLDESGMNIIKSVLIPVRGIDGLLSYDIKKVVVPIKPEFTLPRKRRPNNKSVTSTVSLVQMENVQKIIERNERKEVEKINLIPEQTGRSIDDTARLTDQKYHVKLWEQVSLSRFSRNREEESQTGPSPETPKEEVDRILENLKNICPVCQKCFENEKKMQRHVNRFHKKTHNCDKCEKKYYSRAGLDQHTKVHQDDFYLECSICRLRYKRRAGLRHHMIRAHNTAEPKYICDYCGKGFHLKMDIGVHIEFTHMNVTHICRICGKAAKNIRNHEYLHERKARKKDCRYRCQLCSKRFSTCNNLENHLLMHKDGFKCDRCSEIFSLPAELKRHKSVKHKPGSLCTICDKMFHCKSNFYQHVLTHDGVRPYKCDICGEDFTQRSSLLRHRRTHPGPLPPFTGIAHIADIAKKILQKHRRD